MRLRYTRPALRDLNEILDYIADRSPMGASKVHARLKAVIDLLMEHPRAGAPTDDPDIRRIVALPYPYLLYYQVDDEEIIIHAVRHAKRDLSVKPGTD
jgi:plasmid stabilization system protein ParE